MSIEPQKVWVAVHRDFEDVDIQLCATREVALAYLADFIDDGEWKHFYDSGAGDSARESDGVSRDKSKVSAENVMLFWFGDPTEETPEFQRYGSGAVQSSVRLQDVVS